MVINMPCYTIFIPFLKIYAIPENIFKKSAKPKKGFWQCFRTGNGKTRLSWIRFTMLGKTFYIVRSCAPLWRGPWIWRGRRWRFRGRRVFWPPTVFGKIYEHMCIKTRFFQDFFEPPEATGHTNKKLVSKVTYII